MIVAMCCVSSAATAPMDALRARCLGEPFDATCWVELCDSALLADDYDLAVLACGGALDLLHESSGQLSQQRGGLQGRFDTYVLRAVRAAVEQSSCDGRDDDDEPLERLADTHRLLSIEELVDGAHRGGWALDHLAYSLQLGRPENGHATWPQYCALWRAGRAGWHNAGADAPEIAATEITAMHGLPQIPARLQPQRAKLIVGMLDDEFAREARFLEACSAPSGAQPPCAAVARHPAALARVVRSLRALECSPDFLSHTVSEWIEASAGSREDDEDAAAEGKVVCAADGADARAARPGAPKYNVENYSWGALFAESFLALLRSPAAAPAMRDARSTRRPLVVLGSNIGYEAFYASLGAGLRTVGYEILCHLVDAAIEARDRLAPQHAASAAFVCGDALAADVSDAAAVYLDNDSWDAALTRAVVAKLWREMPSDALLLLWRFEAPDASAEARRFAARWSEVDAVPMHATWSLASDRRVVRVLKRRVMSEGGGRIPRVE